MEGTRHVSVFLPECPTNLAIVLEQLVVES